MKRIFTLLALVALTLSVYAQSPDLMSYQAVLRDAGDNLLMNQAVAIQISILQGAPNGTAVYTEVHSLNTNDNGLVSLMIGDGVTTDDFSTIDWGSGPYFIKTETDPAGGTDYTITSTTQLVSVPYAKYAGVAGNGFSGEYGDLSGAPWTPSGSDVYYDAGNVGIGTDIPAASLDVNGSAKIGTNGVIFNELREVTGTTHATNPWVSFTLPSGYNETNTRVLSIEINYLGDRWMGLGFENSDTDQNISYSINETTMYIYYPESVDYLNNRAFRVLIMQIQ